MSSDRADLAPARRIGERAEGAIIESISEIDHVSDHEQQRYDAVATTAVWPDQQLPMSGICVIERGVPIEIKSCIPRYSDGRRGMFYLRSEQHDELVELGAVYLFAVVEPHTREPIALRAAAARSVSDVVQWRSGGDGNQDCYQLAWSRVIRIEEVEP